MPGSTATNGLVIRAIVSDAKFYQQYDGSSGVAQQAGQNFLGSMAAEVSEGSSQGAGVPAETGMPACADPKDIMGLDNSDSGTLYGDADDASNIDTAGTSQANADVQATLNDVAALNTELATTAPGVQVG
jgi:hypothetical protein